MRYAPADSKTTEKLVAERLALSNRGETTVLNLLGVELKGVVGELEALLDERGELTDAATLLTQNLLGVGCTDDNLTRDPKFVYRSSSVRCDKAHLSAGVGNTDVAARVTLLREFAGEEIVQLGAEDTVGDKLALLADLACHFEGLWTGGEKGRVVSVDPASSDRR